MEKELFISSLKEKSGVDNLSERTIDEVANLFMPSFTEDKEYSDDDWKLPVQMVKTMSGQLRHDMSSGINDFKTKFETENKDKQAKAIQDAIAAARVEWEKGKPAPQTPPATDDKDLDAKIAEAITKSMAGLTSEDGAIGKLSKQFNDYLTQVAAEKKALTEADARSQVRDYLLSRGVDEDDFALEYTLEKLVIGDNPDISVLKTKAEKDYEVNYKKIHKSDGAAPFTGGGGGSRDNNSDFQSYIKRKQEQAEQEAKDAESLRQLLR